MKFVEFASIIRKKIQQTDIDIDIEMNLLLFKQQCGKNCGGCFYVRVPWFIYTRYLFPSRHELTEQCENRKWPILSDKFPRT